MPLFMLNVEMDGVHYAVQSAKTYPSFNEQDPEEGGDLMLLYFDNPDHRNSHVVRLNPDPTVPNPSDVVSLAGYGLESGNWKDRSSCLQEVLDLEVANCQDAPQWWFHTGNLLCTRNGPSHANVCTFDSGSPLLQGETQVGIVSLGDDDDNPSCSNVFAGLTPVALYYDWIHDNLPRIDQEKRETTAV
jgi:Trypsin